MKKKILIPLLLGVALALFTIRASAQTPSSSGTAQPGATGEVTGSLVNRSPGGKTPESLSVMLHILDQNYNQLGMLHAQSQSDGSFRFEGVPLSQNQLYAGIVAYQGATYYSQPVPYDGKTAPNLELPIYEGTNDLSRVQVDEMHVLFNFAQDGLEVSEIYLLSNTGDYTITGTLTLTDGQPATIKFPLPAQADYVFFKPDEADRFVKLDEGFADKTPLVPGKGTSNMMVSYLLPYTEPMTYSYSAPVPVANIDYLIPAEQEVLLDGPNLSGPEITTLQDNSIYQVYGYKGLLEGQTIKLNFLGKPNIQLSSANPVVTKSSESTKNLSIEIGSGVIGLALVGVGVWQWRKSRVDDTDEVADQTSDELRLHQFATEIAQLDEAHEKGTIDDQAYQQRRTDLLKQAKSVLRDMDS